MTTGSDNSHSTIELEFSESVLQMFAANNFSDNECPTSTSIDNIRNCVSSPSSSGDINKTQLNLIIQSESNDKHNCGEGSSKRQSVKRSSSIIALSQPKKRFNTSYESKNDMPFLLTASMDAGLQHDCGVISLNSNAISTTVAQTKRSIIHENIDNQSKLHNNKIATTKYNDDLINLDGLEKRNFNLIQCRGIVLVRQQNEKQQQSLKDLNIDDYNSKNGNNGLDQIDWLKEFVAQSLNVLRDVMINACMSALTTSKVERTTNLEKQVFGDERDHLQTSESEQNMRRVVSHAKRQKNIFKHKKLTDRNCSENSKDSSASRGTWPRKTTKLLNSKQKKQIAQMAPSNSHYRRIDNEKRRHSQHRPPQNNNDYTFLRMSYDEENNRKQLSTGGNGKHHSSTLVRFRPMMIDDNQIENHWKDIIRIHHRARTSPYPTCPELYRLTIGDHCVPWSNECQNYDPPNYTAHEIMINLGADPDIQLNSEIELHFNTLDGAVDRRSVYKHYKVRNGLPLNPIGRTGLIGRGCLLRWGPNIYHYVILCRWKRDLYGNILLHPTDGRKILEVLLEIQERGRETTDLVITGGLRMLGQKFPPQLQDRLERFVQSARGRFSGINVNNINRLFDKQPSVWKGAYFDDARNTDNAWIELLIEFLMDDDILTSCIPKLTLEQLNKLQQPRFIWKEVKSDIEVGPKTHLRLLRNLTEKLGAHF
ncbi:unnamed protein product [Didymodactylos carnosus]|uniref:Uncharacterized protein n=1 Tax=Didymodactylos carnosus TaxID=1234261 RepID=A0A813SBM8_9BILA|nr:unnamed protein product [Didymodactylos carnosus]CAF0854013.1 unnamed protein product [Didymodactylos carnosus]CAF3581765.1 unnamed protein product [Didymodactylos carnosus]CAF3639152.1 unnamed protein product [Didymodactylos carnosus]